MEQLEEKSAQAPTKTQIVGRCLALDRSIELEAELPLKASELKRLFAQQLNCEECDFNLFFAGKKIKRFEIVSNRGPRTHTYQIMMRRHLAVVPFNLTLETAMRCLANYPIEARLFWNDIERNNTLCLSEKRAEGIFHTYYADEPPLEDYQPLYDNLLDEYDINKYIISKSLFDTALTIFKKANRPSDEQECLTPFLLNHETSIKKRFLVDSCLTPNPKLDCLSLIKKYGCALELPPIEVVEEIFRCDIVAELKINVGNLLMAINGKLNTHFANIYFENGVSALGVLTNITTKLQDILCALSTCGLDQWSLGNPRNVLRRTASFN